MLKISYNLILIATLMILTTTTPAWALNWQDTEWAGRGCPSKLSGYWVPLTHSPYAGSKIEFKPKGVTISSKEKIEVFYSFTRNQEDGLYLNLKRIPEDPSSFPMHLKIRPHMAVQSNSEGRKYTLCKIKVFLFESKQKADRMSYLSWDIYSTIDSSEVSSGN